jgi:hypothetical protein
VLVRSLWACLNPAPHALNIFQHFPAARPGMITCPGPDLTASARSCLAHEGGLGGRVLASPQTYATLPVRPLSQAKGVSAYTCTRSHWATEWPLLSIAYKPGPTFPRRRPMCAPQFVVGPQL